MKYSYAFCHVSGILKGFQDQTVPFLIHSLRFDIDACGWENHCRCPGRRQELNPSSFPTRTTPAAGTVLGEGLEVAQGTVASFVPLFLRATNLPVPTRPCWPLCLCSINPKFNKITAAITVLFIWEAKSKIASDLCMHRDASDERSA